MSAATTTELAPQLQDAIDHLLDYVDNAEDYVDTGDLLEMIEALRTYRTPANEIAGADVCRNCRRKRYVKGAGCDGCNWIDDDEQYGTHNITA